MRNVPKNYRDENYRDPAPAGIWSHELLAGKPEWMDVYIVED